MQATTWTCDRCHTRIDVPIETVIVPEYTPAAVRSGFHPEQPEGWKQIATDDAVTDVCPNCLTDADQVDELLRGVGAAAVFEHLENGPEAGA
jgi:hypothetical protein